MPLVSETSAGELARALGEPATVTAAFGAVTGPRGTWRELRLPTDRGQDDHEDDGILALLDEAITRRRSVRAFAMRPVAEAEVAAVLRAARTAAPVLAAGPPLEIAVAVSGGRDRRPGVFRTNEAGELAGMLSGESLVAELHESYAPAPVLLLICGPVPAGADEYRTTLLAAASSGYTAWLAAVAIGLEGCVFGRAHGRVTAALSTACRHLFTVAVGHAA